MNNKLSVIVLTHNDESRIVDCIEGLDFADELIIVDDNSTDRTVEIARKYTDNIFSRSLNKNFADQRNFALNHAHNGWILFVDSDEIISEKLKDEILQKINITKLDGFYIRRVDYMWKRKILNGEVGNIKLLRLVRKKVARWHGKVHEVLRISGKTGDITHSITHKPHESIQEFISDINDYSTIRAVELRQFNKKITAFGIILYPICKFVLNYIFKKGYRDGVPGLLYAVIMSFHSFLAKAKLYQLSYNE